MTRRLSCFVLLSSFFVFACQRRAEPPKASEARAESIVLITIDTLRADHVGAYGSVTARTPVLDALARDGARFDRAWAPAPITLTSHASLLTGRYPPGHGARHNGMPVSSTVPTLAAVAQKRRLPDRRVCFGVPTRSPLRLAARIRCLRRPVTARGGWTCAE